MKTFGRMYFTPDPTSLFIPANPPVSPVNPDPNRRDSVVQPQQTSAQWRSQKRRWSYSLSTGILESAFMFDVDGREINRVLDVARAQHGKTAVTQITLYVNPACLDDCYTQLIHYGYERRGDLEGKIPQLVFVSKSPKRWKE
jgi:hypothetical protein